MRIIGCWFGAHQWIPIRHIWVRFQRQIYFDNKYAEEGEQIVTKLYCPVCGKMKEIKVDL